MNYDLNKVIGDNETGFRGTNDAAYRIEAWDFLLAGGGLFNNLDYSFVAGHEDGTFAYPATQPGGGNPRCAASTASRPDGAPAGFSADAPSERSGQSGVARRGKRALPGQPRQRVSHLRENGAGGQEGRA